MALATGMKTTFLDRLYKTTGNNGHLHVVACSYATSFKIQYCLNQCHGRSKFCSSLLSFSCFARVMVSELMSFLASWLVRPYAQIGCGKCACARNVRDCSIWPAEAGISKSRAPAPFSWVQKGAGHKTRQKCFQPRTFATFTYWYKRIEKKHIVS